MKTKIIAKTILKILQWILHIALLLAILFFMWLLHEIMVYEEHYRMIGEYVISYENMDVCKMICFVFMILNLSISVISRFYNKVFSVIHFLLAQFGIIYFCWLLLV